MTRLVLGLLFGLVPVGLVPVGLVPGGLLPTTAYADYLADRARPVVEAAHAEIRAVHLGRHEARNRWNEMLDEALYTLAPKGRWNPDHPAWPAARAALATALREGSVVALAGEMGDWVRRVVNERYSSLEPEEIARAAAFNASPGGVVFRDYREKVLAENAYGLPYVVETKPRDVMRQTVEVAKEQLLNLPDEQTGAVYELLGVENNLVAESVGKHHAERHDLPAPRRRRRGDSPRRARRGSEHAAGLDMPWLGNGERARLFTDKSSYMMCPTGYQFHRSWGRSGRSGSDPYGDVGRALRFLRTKDVLDAWPEAIGEGSVGDGKEIIESRAAPYRFTIVMLEPMVVVMRSTWARSSRSATSSRTSRSAHRG